MMYGHLAKATTNTLFALMLTLHIMLLRMPTALDSKVCAHNKLLFKQLTDARHSFHRSLHTVTYIYNWHQTERQNRNWMVNLAMNEITFRIRWHLLSQSSASLFYRIVLAHIKISPSIRMENKSIFMSSDKKKTNTPYKFSNH